MAVLLVLRRQSAPGCAEKVSGAAVGAGRDWLSAAASAAAAAAAAVYAGAARRGLCAAVTCTAEGVRSETGRVVGGAGPAGGSQQVMEDPAAV